MNNYIEQIEEILEETKQGDIPASSASEIATILEQLKEEKNKDYPLPKDFHALQIEIIKEEDWRKKAQMCASLISLKLDQNGYE